MNITCPRCGALNRRWEVRCSSCWLPFDAAMRSAAMLPTGATANTGNVGDDLPKADPKRAADQPRATDPRPVVNTPRVPDNPAHTTLAALLGIEARHVRALADAGIHTLENIAESLPEHITHALGDIAHGIDPRTLIARAKSLLRRDPAPKPEPEAIPWWKSADNGPESR